MITRSEACFLLLAVALGSISAFHCLTKCTYQSENYSGKIQMNCPIKNDHVFTVKIQPGQSIEIDCVNATEWSYFSLNRTALTRDENIKSMTYKCHLPSNSSLGEIARILGATDLEELVVIPPNYLKSIVGKHILCDFENLKYLTLQINYVENILYKYMYDKVEFNWGKRNLHFFAGLFNCTPRLEGLELDSNELSTLLELGAFDNLKNLTSLCLKNSIYLWLRIGIFDELAALKTLQLYNNKMIELPENIFAKLKNLEIIMLNKNKFIDLPRNLLRNNAKLHTIDLSDNMGPMRTLRNEFFANFTELKELKLRNNKFVTLPEDLFWGCTSLTNITLKRNYLQTLSVQIFRDLKQLKELELNDNNLETLPDHIFSNTNQLVRLDLSKNRITFISKHLFNGLYALEDLNMEENRLVTISHYGFSSLKKLKIAKLSKNHLMPEYVNGGTFYEQCKMLEELYLAHNNISEIFFDRIFGQSQLRKVDLKYNNITSITIDILDTRIMPNNIQVDLTYNKIKYIFLHNIEDFIGYSWDVNKYVEIMVDNNPLHCDCQLYNFLRYIKSRMHLKIQNYFQIRPGNLTCQSPKELENVRVTDLGLKLLTCVVNNPVCPEKCNCFERLQDNAFIFDCSQRNLTSVPSDIKKPDYIRFELNFSGNRLTHMLDLKAMELESVKKLILSHNSITEISLEGLSSTIQVLELHNNNLSRIYPDVLKFLKQSTNLTRLTLHKNPWECDCDAKEFQSFIRNQTRNVMIPDLINVKCVGTNISVSEMTDFCAVNTTTIIGISIAISLIGILIGFFGLLYYKYQQHIKVWLFAHQWCLWFVTEEELDKEKLYDAFVSYSHKDHDFVVSELVPELENGSISFKMCLHYRDWVVGEWIPANIISSVENSRRTIVVLSPNFLESVWGRLEFRAAHSQALNEGRARVILILYGDIGPTDNLDPELKAYISMNTYVTWGDPWFWDKLKYALPHRTNLARYSAVEMKILEDHQLCTQANGNKKELVYPSGLPETPSTTTPPTDTLKKSICDKEPEEE